RALGTLPGRRPVRGEARRPSEAVLPPRRRSRAARAPSQRHRPLRRGPAWLAVPAAPGTSAGPFPSDTETPRNATEVLQRQRLHGGAPSRTGRADPAGPEPDQKKAAKIGRREAGHPGTEAAALSARLPRVRLGAPP